MTNVYKYLIESYNDKQSNSQSDNNELIYPPCDRLGLKRLVTTDPPDNTPAKPHCSKSLRRFVVSFVDIHSPRLEQIS